MCHECPRLQRVRVKKVERLRSLSTLYCRRDDYETAVGRPCWPRGVRCADVNRDEALGREPSKPSVPGRQCTLHVWSERDCTCEVREVIRSEPTDELRPWVKSS